MTRSRLLLILSVTVPAAVALLVGLTHPADLTPATAEYWRNLHIGLLPVFPLIGAVPWVLTRGDTGPFRWIATIGGYLFATCYTSLDVLAGIAGGTLVLAGDSDVTGPVFRIADTLAAVGVVGLVIGMVAATIAIVRRAGLPAIAGGLLAAVGAGLILPGHVWFPIGTLALALLIAGSAVLASARATETVSTP